MAKRSFRTRIIILVYSIFILLMTSACNENKWRKVQISSPDEVGICWSQNGYHWELHSLYSELIESKNITLGESLGFNLKDSKSEITPNADENLRGQARVYGYEVGYRGPEGYRELKGGKTFPIQFQTETAWEYSYGKGQGKTDRKEGKINLANPVLSKIKKQSMLLKSMKLK